MKNVLMEIGVYILYGVYIYIYIYIYIYYIDIYAYIVHLYAQCEKFCFVIPKRRIAMEYKVQVTQYLLIIEIAVLQ